MSRIEDALVYLSRHHAWPLVCSCHPLSWQLVLPELLRRFFFPFRPPSYHRFYAAQSLLDWSNLLLRQFLSAQLLHCSGSPPPLSESWPYSWEFSTAQKATYIGSPSAKDQDRTGAQMIINRSAYWICPCLWFPIAALNLFPRSVVLCGFFSVRNTVLISVSATCRLVIDDNPDGRKRLIWFARASFPFSMCKLARNSWIHVHFLWISWPRQHVLCGSGTVHYLNMAGISGLPHSSRAKNWPTTTRGLCFKRKGHANSQT